jgi:pyruvate/2-oxoglutarate dehydrogenase complex dihydrolipoamide acyltransferase (E2) component
MAPWPAWRRPRRRRRLFSLVDAVHAQGAALDAALAARHVGLLVGERLVHEGARLVRAGHHAVAAADAGVAVDQHDAVGALERGAGGADVDARRLGAVLAHHRHRMRAAGLDLLELDLADPLRRGRRGRGSRPFSVLQAVTQSVQPLAHLVVSISMPQRTLGLARFTGWHVAGLAACAISISWMPGASIAPPRPTAATPRKPRRVADAGLATRSRAHRSWFAPAARHRARLAGVAAEAVDLHRRVAVAADAEVGLRLATLPVWLLAWQSMQPFRLNFAPRMPPCTVSSRWCFSISMWLRRM